MTTDILAVRGCLAAAISTTAPKPMSVREEDVERDNRIARWLELHRQLQPAEEPDPTPYTDENDEPEDLS